MGHFHRISALVPDDPSNDDRQAERLQTKDGEAIDDRKTVIEYNENVPECRPCPTSFEPTGPCGIRKRPRNVPVTADVVSQRRTDKEIAMSLSSRFSFLGYPSIQDSSGPLGSGTFDRPMALLAYLAALPGPQNRETVSTLLWAGKDSREARANLSSTIYNLEQRIGGRISLEKTRQTIGWSAGSLAWELEPVDLRQYLRKDPPAGCDSLHSPAACSRCRNRLEIQRDLGRKEFLEGVPISRMGAFGFWVEKFRTFLSHRQKELERTLSGAAPDRFFSTDISSGTLEIRQFTFLAAKISPSPETDPEKILLLRKIFEEKSSLAVVEGGGEAVNSSVGSSLIFVFGMARTEEDTAVLAARTAREIRKAAESDPRLRYLPIALALHTDSGLADMRSGDPDSDGHRIREVARILRRGVPGEIVATRGTACLVGEAYEVAYSHNISEDSDGPGRSLYLIREEKPPLPFLKSPLVGRESEQARVREIWQETMQTSSRKILWLSGEAGLGKTALLSSVVSSLRRQNMTTREIVCLSTDRERPYAPLVRFIREQSCLLDDLSLSERLYRAEKFLLSVSLPVTLYLSVLLSLIYGKGPWSREIEHLSPSSLEKETESLILSLLSFSSGTPALLAIDNIQWMDPRTHNLLREAVRKMQVSPVLVLLTAREESSLRALELPEPDEALCLQGLTRRESLRMIESLSHRPPDLGAVRRAIAWGRGIPLFLRELVRSGVVEEDFPKIPPSLRDILFSRFSSLPEGREMVKVAAVLGKFLPESLLEKATTAYLKISPSGCETRLWLKELLGRGILRECRSTDEPGFEFSCELFREAVLESLPGSVRQNISNAVSLALRDRSPSAAIGNLLPRDEKFLVPAATQNGGLPAGVRDERVGRISGLRRKPDIPAPRRILRSRSPGKRVEDQGRAMGGIETPSKDLRLPLAST